MAHEARHIRDDWAAFWWSLGCVLASYRQITSADSMARMAVRLFIAVLLFYFAYDNLLGPAQAIGCYVHASQSAMSFLATLPNDRIICVSWPAVPLVLQLLSVVAGGLYLIAGIATLRNWRGVLVLFPVAFLTGLIAFGCVQAAPSLHAYWSSPLLRPLLAHVALSHGIIPLLAASGVWLSLSGNKVSSVRTA